MSATVTQLKSALVELDRIAKMLVRRDLALSVSRENLLAEKGKIDAVINSLLVGLIMFDLDGKIVLINPKARNILCIQEQEEKILEKQLSDFIFISNVKKLYEIIKNNTNPSKQYYEIVFDNPEESIFQVQITNVITTKQEIIGSMVILRDVTKEKLIDKMKSEFISTATHQLRTPLTAIKWAIEMILNGDVGVLNKEQKELLSEGYKSNEKVIKLVNDLLNVSKIEQGKFDYRFNKCNIVEVLNIAIKNLQPLIIKKHLKLIFNKSVNIPKIFLDKEKILLALQNIIDNAVKYSLEYDIIKINLKIQDNFLQINIKDNGIGIPKRDQFKIFNKFFRASNAMKLETEGSGFGLFIAKNIIEKHGGTISIKSNDNAGTEVRVNLPI